MIRPEATFLGAFEATIALLTGVLQTNDNGTISYAELNRFRREHGQPALLA
ncbi:hypothetical protein [Aeromicrobium chenweiae]|uniref:hypothetical protein n=1 Tax=Aeromicrobium chenweiae TaxID=2079793 RepID=UPI00131F0E5E|nr:hypothetical protein [Aeromicrobium chenweiae]